MDALNSWLEQDGILAALIAGAVALLGHLLVFWRDAVARTFSPKIEIALLCNFFPAHGSSRPIELKFVISNCGGAKAKIANLKFRVRGIGEGAALDWYEPEPSTPSGPGLPAKVLAFPLKLAQGEFASSRQTRIFVDAGATQPFTVSTIIPNAVSLIQVHVVIAIRQRFEHFLPFHRTRRYLQERVVQVPDDPLPAQPIPADRRRR